MSAFVLTTVVPLTPPTRADYVVPGPPSPWLPNVSGPAVVSDGTFLYLMGGMVTSTQTTNAIARYDPVTRTALTLGARLPEPLVGAGVAWDGTTAYLFGGMWCSPPHCDISGTIQRFTPSQGIATRYGATLPPLFRPSAVWTGSAVYVLGGDANGVPKREIYKFDPPTGALTDTGARLISGTSDAAVAYAGGRIYLFHGGAVQRYDLSTNTVTVLSTSLAFGTGQAFPSTDGTFLIVPRTGSAFYRFDPATEIATPLASGFFVSGGGFGGAVLGDRAILLGGLDPIVEIDLATARVTVPRLPTGFDLSRAVSTGTELLVPINSGSSDGVKRVPVVRHDLATGLTTASRAVFPDSFAPRSPTWANGALYVFGSFTDPRIFRYDPVQDTITHVGTLPYAPGNAGTIFTGSHFYLFGGSTTNRNVLKVDASTFQVTILPAALPSPRFSTFAMMTGSTALVLSADWVGTPMRDAHVFDPASGQLTYVGAFPTLGVTHTTATWSGSTAYLTGIGAGNTLKVAAYHPATNRSALLTNVPIYAWHHGAVRQGNATLVFGAGDPKASFQFARHFDTPGIPGITTFPGPGRGEVRLNLTLPPANTSGAPVTSYRIYEGTSPNTTTFAFDLPVGTSTWVRTGLGDGETRYYRLSAVNEVGEGAWSQAVPGAGPSPPSPPRNVTWFPSIIPGGIRLNWMPPASDGNASVTAYHLYRQETPGSGQFVYLTRIVGALTHLDTTCPAGKICVYHVRAVNLAGESAPSNGAGGPGSTMRPQVSTNETPPAVWNDANSNGRIDEGERIA